MEFYTEFKWPSIADYYLDGVPDPIPWTDELRTLIEIHRMYRAWRKENPSLTEPPDKIKEALSSITEIHATLEGNISDSFDYPEEEETALKIKDILKNRTKRQNVDDILYFELYPGLKDKDYSSNGASVAVFSFDTEFDLDTLASNKAGIPAEEQTLNKLLPLCKWISGIIELPIEMTKEQIEEEERDETGYGGWWYIARDLEVCIAGIQLDAYIPDGSKYFYVNKERYNTVTK